LHHESSSDGVERIRNDSRETGHELGEDEFQDDAGLLFIGKEELLSRIVATEVAGSVEEDSSD